ncbi:MAG: hypothetical protein ACLR5T_04775 [Veillonella sp.]
MGYVDEDGFIHLNRRTDLIISGGENIYPKEIEDTVYAMQGVKECAVIPCLMRNGDRCQHISCF